MIQRCTNPNHGSFSEYGGRGITVCIRWWSFDNFLSDMGICPDGLTLERIDNAKGYRRENCRWATRMEQARNTRQNRVFTVNGITACLKELCEIFQMNYQCVRSRLRMGWTIERALKSEHHLDT
jgi:hypothetical protein